MGEQACKNDAILLSIFVSVLILFVYVMMSYLYPRSKRMRACNFVSIELPPAVYKNSDLIGVGSGPDGAPTLPSLFLTAAELEMFSHEPPAPQRGLVLTPEWSGVDAALGPIIALYCNIPAPPMLWMSYLGRFPLHSAHPRGTEIKTNFTDPVYMSMESLLLRAENRSGCSIEGTDQSLFKFKYGDAPMTLDSTFTRDYRVDTLAGTVEVVAKTVGGATMNTADTVDVERRYKRKGAKVTEGSME